MEESARREFEVRSSDANGDVCVEGLVVDQDSARHRPTRLYVRAVANFSRPTMVEGSIAATKTFVRGARSI